MHSRPTFVALQRAYPDKSLSGVLLYDELGIRALANEPAYENAAAIRMSYALAGAGVVLRKGALQVKRGPHLGQRIEPCMRRLAEQLVELWGRPEQFGPDHEWTAALAMRQGVVVFFRGVFLPVAGARGCIDLLPMRRSGFDECVDAGFVDLDNTIWFWPLD